MVKFAGTLIVYETLLIYCVYMAFIALEQRFLNWGKFTPGGKFPCFRENFPNYKLCSLLFINFIFKLHVSF